MENSPLSRIELSKNNLIHNFKALKSITKNTKIIVAIKGNAYGHGQNEVASILEKYVDAFQVNSFSELKLLRKISKKKTFVLGYIQKDNLKETMKLDCVLSLFSLENLEEINKIAKLLKIKQEIHIPIDAYLGREGFLKEGLIEFLKKIKDYKNIKLTGIYAHFANIEDTNNFTHARKQIKKYEEAVKITKKAGFKNIQTHISATSGLLVYEKNKAINSFVRLGIGIYGLWPSEHIKFLYKNKLELKPVLSWKTKIAQIKNVPAGYTIGYGLTYMTYAPKKIAVIPLGYADGISRNFSNKGEVLIKGEKCKILGRLAMNMFVVDVTHIKDIKNEEEVVILGKQGSEHITADEMANKIGSINYEIVTNISPLLPRVIV
ncbi:MAG: alanine racemase [Burkholderiales bacterium]|nr:alanine racemase [Burkholderiales bacterium]